MPLHRPDGDEQGLGNLSVRKPVCGQLGDAALAGSECLKPGKHHPAWLGAGGAQFGLGPFGQCSGSKMVRRVDGLAQQFPGLHSAVGPTQEGPEVGQGAGMLETRIRAGEDIARLSEKDLAAMSTSYETGGPERHTKSTRGAKGAGQRKLFGAQISRHLVVDFPVKRDEQNAP